MLYRVYACVCSNVNGSMTEMQLKSGRDCFEEKQTHIYSESFVSIDQSIVIPFILWYHLTQNTPNINVLKIDLIDSL